LNRYTSLLGPRYLSWYSDSLRAPGRERHFPHPSRQILGSTQPPIQWVPGLSWG